MIDTNSIAAKFTQWRLFFKVAFILFLILMLMIPNLLIQELIYERQTLESQTQYDIASSHGPEQRVLGPVLSIPYVIGIDTDKGVKYVDHTLHILPTDVDIHVVLETEERSKSIYTAMLYTADHTIEGKFKLPSKDDFVGDIHQISWGDASIDLGFAAAASLADVVKITVGGYTHLMRSGSSDHRFFDSGIHAQIDLSDQKGDLTFSTQFLLNGSKALRFAPFADNTTVYVECDDWASPGFVGNPAPQMREVRETGFSASWRATEYNRAYKSMWVDMETSLDRTHANFGVELIQTVGHYQKNMRSAKYALLIISLSFLIFFFFEILKGRKIHPLQYVFVGLALSIFYALLLSLSEHLGFDLAYLIGASAVVGLISWYSQYLLGARRDVMLLSISLGGLYTYIYCLLQMQDFALLVGSVGLFVILAIVMYLSRNFNWYNTN